MRNQGPDEKTPAWPRAAGPPPPRRYPRQLAGESAVLNPPTHRRPGGRWSSACTPGTRCAPGWSPTTVAALGGDRVFPSPALAVLRSGRELPRPRSASFPAFFLAGGAPRAPAPGRRTTSSPARGGLLAGSEFF